MFRLNSLIATSSPALCGVFLGILPPPSLEPTSWAAVARRALCPVVRKPSRVSGVEHACRDELQLSVFDLISLRRVEPTTFWSSGVKEGGCCSEHHLYLASLSLFVLVAHEGGR